MKWHLRGFADRAAEDEQACGGEIRRVHGDGVQILLDTSEHDRASGQPEHENTEHEAEVADAVDGEGLLGGVRRGVFAEVMSDEQVGTDADQFPEDEHHDEVVGQDDTEHGKEEEAERCVVAGDALVAAHVARRVNENEQRDGCDHDEHDPAQVVEDDADGDGENAGDFDPRNLRGDGEGWIEENFPAEEAGERCGEDSDRAGRDIVAREDEKDERGRDERGEEDNPGIKLRIHRGVRISSG